LQSIAHSGILTTELKMTRNTSFDKDNFKKQFHGRCAEIGLALAPHCRKMIERRPKNGPCPKCKGKDRARCFNDFDDTGGVFCNQCGQKGCSDLIGFLSWANDWSRSHASKEIKKYLNRAKAPQQYRKLNKNKSLTSHNSANEKKNNQVWKETKKDTGVIKKYFKHRGLSGLVPKGIRLHPGLSFYEDTKGGWIDRGRFPAMISPIMNGLKLVGIHKTWLNKDGKGKIPFEGSKKTGKIDSSISGGVIKLFPAESGIPLVIAEGIETAIAVHEATRWPAWSCVSAMNFQKITIPQKFKPICLAVDLDKSGTGEREAKKLAQKLLKENRQVFFGVPSGSIPENEKSLDWLDVLKKEGRKTVKNFFLNAEPWKLDEGDTDPTKQREDTEKKNKLNQAKVADIVIEKYDYKIIYCNQEFFHYSSGLWANVPKEKIKKLITDVFGYTATGSKTTGTLNVLQSKCYEEDHSPQRDYIGLLNGDLDPIESKVHEHSPTHYIFNQLSIDWEPSAKCELWKRTLKEIFQVDEDSKEKLEFLQEWFGYCLIPKSHLHKFLWMVGPGANGKSLILNVLSAVVGDANISYAHLDRLDKGHVRASLLHKLVNISSEMKINTKIADGYLKEIVAGDSIEADAKFQPLFSFRPYVRLVGATNELPALKDFSEGFRRRAIILTFNRILKEEEQDKYREEKILKELSGILVWAIEGLKRLMKNSLLTVPSSSKETLNQYIHDSDPIRQFVEEKLMVDKKGTPPGNMYSIYQIWSYKNGHKEIFKPALGLRLRQLGYKKRKSNGQEFWNLKVKNEKIKIKSKFKKG
jgi:P4 family phage/plasmid primase-like protien